MCPLPPGPIRAVFFDLDETLLDDARSMREAGRATCEALADRCRGLDADRLEVAWTRVSAEAWAGFGSVPPPDGANIRVGVWGRALAECGVDDGSLAEEGASLYAVNRRATYRLFPDALDLLGALQSRVRLGLITNGNGDIQREKLRITGLDGLLDPVVVSSDLGRGKPEPLIFRIALAATGVAAPEAMHVGDSLASDVAGARAAGLFAAWINRGQAAPEPDAVAPDVEIASLAELLPLVLDGR